jgi:hypothetical protein
MTAALALDHDSSRPTEPGRSWDLLLPAMLTGVAVLGAIGAIGSFTNVAAVAQADGWDRPWLLPLGVDGAIAFFTGLDFALARIQRQVAWLRWFAWALIAVTIGLNVAGKTTLFGVLGHAALPALFAAAVEAAKATMTARAVEHVDRIPVARWLYAPIPTLLIHRRMRLWRVTSYAEALELDRGRILARCSIVEAHGYSWRWAPSARRARALYRLGEHATPTEVADDPADTTPAAPALEQPAPRPPVVRRRTPAKKAARPAKATDDQLADIAVALAAEDPAVLGNWKSLAAALRKRGHGLGTTRANAVLDLARARKETPDAP